VERAVLEASRLNEMVWNMDVQINKLNEALKDAHRSEETVGRIEGLVQQTNVTVEAITKARDDLARQSVRFEKDGRTLMDGLRTSLDRVALEKKEIDALETHPRALQGTAAETEARMEALGALQAARTAPHPGGVLREEGGRGRGQGGRSARQGRQLRADDRPPEREAREHRFHDAGGRNTLQTLRTERELAERLEQSSRSCGRGRQRRICRARRRPRRSLGG
jgi:chromosome segregation ATPase